LDQRTTDMLTSYYLKLRTPVGFDQGVGPTVLVRVADDVRSRTRAGLHTWLLDMTPSTSSFRDAGLVVGQTFTDPAGVQVASASIPDPAGGQSVAVGTLVNGAPWTIVIYLNQDPDAPGAPPLTFIAPASSFRIAFRPGQHLLVARPTGAAPGSLPKVTWRRQIEIDPRVRGFKLHFNEADFQ
jgi:hypothetical protein